jgi:hypothetical protein
MSELIAIAILALNMLAVAIAWNHGFRAGKRALWLWSRDNKVEWSKHRCNVPAGISPASTTDLNG